MWVKRRSQADAARPIPCPPVFILRGVPQGHGRLPRTRSAWDHGTWTSCGRPRSSHPQPILGTCMLFQLTIPATWAIGSLVLLPVGRAPAGLAETGDRFHRNTHAPCATSTTPRSIRTSSAFTLIRLSGRCGAPSLIPHACRSGGSSSVVRDDRPPSWHIVGKPDALQQEHRPASARAAVC